MPQISSSRFTVNAGWDDAPHLDPRTKKQMMDATPHWMRAARTKGIPSKGAGAIYPIESKLIKVPPFQIPQNWPRGYGMDVGWNVTCAIWFAFDANADTYYGYTEHYAGQEKPLVHSQAIKARGDWIPGFIDPASRGRAQDDGQKLLEQYQGHGLKVTVADNEVDAGLIRIWELLAFGRLKIFETCMYWFSEYEHYRRDENGKIVKKNDHLMDATRYFFNSGTGSMRVKPADRMLSEHGGSAGYDNTGY